MCITTKNRIDMKQVSTLLLKAVIVLIGLGVLAICLVALPYALITDVTGYYRPIVIGMYVPAIPFFIALWQGLKILNLIDTNEAFSERAVNALKTIKYCGFAISVIYVLGMPYIFYAANLDDAPGVVLIACIIVGSSFIIASAAALFQKLFQNALDIKSENDLTV